MICPKWVCRIKQEVGLKQNQGVVHILHQWNDVTYADTEASVWRVKSKQLQMIEQEEKMFCSWKVVGFNCSSYYEAGAG